MGLFNVVQDWIVKYVIRNKSKLLAGFLVKLTDGYDHNKMLIATDVWNHFPVKWRETASPEETSEAIELTRVYITKMYDVINRMRKPADPNQIGPSYPVK